MCLVLAATGTELRELQATGGRFFVLCRRVVALFALSALQSYDFPHFNSFQNSNPLSVGSKQ
jgi:hypothetical protein